MYTLTKKKEQSLFLSSNSPHLLGVLKISCQSDKIISKIDNGRENRV